MKKGDYIVCRRCKGKGENNKDILDFIFHWPTKCSQCKGKGYIKVK